jgi:hypothetical protein
VIERAPAMTLICRQAVRLFVWAVVALVCAGAVARAQDDREPVEQVEAIPQALRARAERARQLIRMNNKVIERQLVRQLEVGIGSAQALEKRLASRIRELNDLCRLTEPQVKKLHLAGRGDIKRYTDRLDSLVKRTTENDSGADSKLGLEMHDLEKTRDRLFDDGSLFSKTVVKTLSQDQLDRIDAVDRHTNMRLYRDAVTQATRGLAGLANLSTKQTEELSNLILAETRPPRRFGQSDYALVMFQASRLPESKLKPIFLEAQWKLLKQHVASWNDAEQFLRSEGFVFDDSPASSKTQSQAAGGRNAEVQLKKGAPPP